MILLVPVDWEHDLDSTQCLGLIVQTPGKTELDAPSTLDSSSITASGPGRAVATNQLGY